MISDTAEYGCYLFAHACVPPCCRTLWLLVGTDVIGKGLEVTDNSVDNSTPVAVNAEIRYHLIEEVGQELRSAMQGMQAIV
ncbi:MAG: hypothetical protein R2864_05645 [Syntrophotaleaceae bacterium]